MAQSLKKTNYHHGNLKSGLIDAAVEMLVTQTPDNLSLRKLAARLGVSQTAVYSHFADKTALLAAIAAYGFQLQAEYMAGRVRDIRDPYERVEALSIAYMAFAQENRALFQVMFSREVQDIEDHKPLSLSAGKPYALFAAAWSRYRPQQTGQIVHLWSMLHGQTLLLCDPKFGPALANGRSPRDVARAAIAVFA